MADKQFIVRWMPAAVQLNGDLQARAAVLKTKATGMGTPVAINTRLNRNYAAKQRRAHTDCPETTTDAKFIIKQRASFLLYFGS